MRDKWCPLAIRDHWGPWCEQDQWSGSAHCSGFGKKGEIVTESDQLWKPSNWTHKAERQMEA